MKTPCKKSARFGPVESHAGQEPKRLVDELRGDEEVDQKMAQTFAALWADSGIQKTYAMRSRYQLDCSVDYFLGKLDEVRIQFVLRHSQIAGC